METTPIILTSPAFANGETIPSKYTCDGDNVNPALSWSGLISEATQSFVLIMDDPDVPLDIRPDGMFDHWVVFNIPADVRNIDEAAVPPGIQGANTRGDNAYRGPCPPDGEHRYFFKLFAVDRMIDLQAGATKAEVIAAIDGHILATGELMGRYDRQR